VEEFGQGEEPELGHANLPSRDLEHETPPSPGPSLASVDPPTCSVSKLFHASVLMDEILFGERTASVTDRYVADCLT
jgi:hypothetical protein